MNKNLVWFTGAPGSKWSGTANVFQAIGHLNFNTTDRTPEREYRHVGPTTLARSIVHTGVYFGPGHGFGEDWNNFTNLDPAHIEQQVIKEWSDPSWGRLLVKSHFLSHHLDSIANRWPDSPIIMVFRPNDKCSQGWYGAGGWNISYPDYRPFYKDDDTMHQMINEHNVLMRDFCQHHDVKINKFTREWFQEEFNWTVNDLEDQTYREFVDVHLYHTEHTDDVEIAIYNRHLLV